MNYGKFAETLREQCCGFSQEWKWLMLLVAYSGASERQSIQSAMAGRKTSTASVWFTCEKILLMHHYRHDHLLVFSCSQPRANKLTLIFFPQSSINVYTNLILKILGCCVKCKLKVNAGTCTSHTAFTIEHIKIKQLYNFREKKGHFEFDWCNMPASLLLLTTVWELLRPVAGLLLSHPCPIAAQQSQVFVIYLISWCTKCLQLVKSLDCWQPVQHLDSATVQPNRCN